MKKFKEELLTLTSSNFPYDAALEGFELMERAFMTFRKRKIIKKGITGL